MILTAEALSRSQEAHAVLFKIPDRHCNASGVDSRFWTTLPGCTCWIVCFHCDHRGAKRSCAPHNLSPSVGLPCARLISKCSRISIRSLTRYPILRLALPKADRFGAIVSKAVEWSLEDKVARTVEEQGRLDGLRLGRRTVLIDQLSISTVDEPAVLAMLVALSEVMSAYSNRDVNEEDLMERRRDFGIELPEGMEGSGPSVQHVTNLFDDHGRDTIIFEM